MSVAISIIIPHPHCGSTFINKLTVINMLSVQKKTKTTKNKNKNKKQKQKQKTKNKTKQLTV
jgi:hypothetical protein